MKLILGIAGRIGAGKDTAADYLARKHNFFLVSTSEIIHEMLEKQGIEVNRENLQKARTLLNLPKNPDYWLKLLDEEVKFKNPEFAAINGIRRPEEVSRAQADFGTKFKLLVVEASPKTRFERLKARQDPRDPKIFAEFEQQDAKETEIYGISKTIRDADFVIKNESILEKFYLEIDRIVNKYF